jgi:glucosyl-3-phosphoglycerate phosphatase
LSALGRQQADALASAISALNSCRVITSDLVRARETAVRLEFPEARQEPRLREINVGTWHGQAIANLLADEPVNYHAWLAGTHRP